MISCVSDCVCPYIDGKWDEVLALARSEDLRDRCIQHHRGRHRLPQGDSAVRSGASQQLPAKLTRVLYRALQGIQRRC
ncbi:MAG: hypothetical protein ACLVJH_18250 [Faecalibacterium prausnitzii]